MKDSLLEEFNKTGEGYGKAIAYLGLGVDSLNNGYKDIKKIAKLIDIAAYEEFKKAQEALGTDMYDKNQRIYFQAVPDLANLTKLEKKIMVNPQRYKSISEKDFHKAKSHKIRYKKIFNSEVDLAKLEVEILPSKKKKAASLNKEATIDSSLFDSESQAMDNISEKEKNTQHDATVIEYCPRIFRDLRRIDDISGYDLEKYFYLI